MKRLFSLLLTLALFLTACGDAPAQDSSVPSFRETVPPTTKAPTTQVTEPSVTQPAPEGLVCEGKSYDSLDDLMDALQKEGRLEQEDHSITIEGLQTPVTFQLRFGQLVGYTAYDYTFPVDREALGYTELWGNVSAELYDYQDRVILNIWHDDIGYTLILGPEGGWVHYPFEGRSLMVYADETGALLCSQMAVKFNSSLHQWETAAIDLAASRDDFFYATGTCTLEGTDVQPVLLKEYTISDAYDLDAIFESAKADGLYPQYDTLDQLLAQNWEDQHQPGDEEQEDGLSYYDTYWDDGTLKTRIAYYFDHKVCADSYDEQGRLVRQVQYDVSGESHSFQHTYDDQDQLTGLSCVYHDTEVYRYTMSYDGQGRLVEKTRFREGVQTGQQLWEYGSDGGWTETFLQNGQKKYTYQFDSDGDLVRHITYRDGIAAETGDVEGLVKAQLLQEARLPFMDNSPIHYSFRYDGCDLIYSTAFYGDLVHTTYEGSFHKPLNSTIWSEYEEGQVDTTYVYDDQGRMTEQILSEAGNEIRRDVFTYEGDTQIQRGYDDQGQLSYEIRRTYADGMLTDYEIWNAPGEVYRQEYRRSDDGRTVEVTTYRDGVQEDRYTRTYDEAGRLQTQNGQYRYDEDGMLQSVFLATGEYPNGTAVFDYRVVYVTQAQAQELTDIMDQVLEWTTW